MKHAVREEDLQQIRREEKKERGSSGQTQTEAEGRLAGKGEYKEKN